METARGTDEVSVDDPDGSSGAQGAEASPLAPGSPEPASLPPATTLPWLESGPASEGGAGSAAPPDSGARIAGLNRYEDLGLLGRGGMGEVRRVRDRHLGRTLALKVIHAQGLRRPGLVARFLEEAQATAQLQHPNIIPIYDLGRLPDGRLWFTMKEVTGPTLAAVLDGCGAPALQREPGGVRGWGPRRVVGALVKVCEAMDYAHRRGVVHRDLKPANIMVGEHGEVLVLDWGLAKILGHGDLLEATSGEGAVETDRSAAPAHQTQVGCVAGTPAYMAPEQARGEVDCVGPASDIYSLGAILYELLAGRPPYAGDDALHVLEQVRAGPPPALRPGRALPRTPAWGASGSSGEPAPLPAVLVRACARAMARAAEERFSSAGALAEALQAWLEGSQRRQDALEVMDSAAQLAPRAARFREEAAGLRAEARALLATVPQWAPEEDKVAGWRREDEAARLEQAAEALEIDEEIAFHGALAHSPALPEAHACLANRYRVEHASLESRREDAARVEARLRHHLAWLPHDNPSRASHEAYLRGEARFSLTTDPPGATVELYRFVPSQRRLAPQRVRHLGVTPLREVPLERGSYLCLVQHPACEPVHYPFHLGRGEHWEGVPPGDKEPHAVCLPLRGTLGPNEQVVPAGWAWLGGDPDAALSLPRRRVWVDGFVARRFPVTNAEYLAFLDDLVASGRTEAALRVAPRERAGTEGGLGALILGFEGERFSLRPDADGDTWEPGYPVTMVTWEGATAYAAWLAARTGLPWRLPSELMWEKAARGVDGRRFPWGDGFDPSWCCMKDSHPGRKLPSVVDRFATDESPYGIRGMAGNASDWCSDRFAAEGPELETARAGGAPVPLASGGYQVVRGGGWFGTAAVARSANRRYLDSTYRGFDLSFRLVRWMRTGQGPAEGLVTAEEEKRD